MEENGQKKLKPLSLYEQLSYSTIQIKCDLRNGNKSTGTGFFFHFDAESPYTGVDVIVTNKHVIQNADLIEMVFSTQDRDGNQLHQEHFIMRHGNPEQSWIPHPEPDIDLCILVVHMQKFIALNEGKLLDYIVLTKDNFPTPEQYEDLDMLHNILMVGYPDGLSDTVNNKPIFRKGITATSPKFDYRGWPMFLIDSAVYPGSSGSPVFIADDGTYTHRGGAHFASRLFLLGVVFAVYNSNADGEVELVTINQLRLKTKTRVPNHLGMVIKFSKIMDFEPILRRQIPPAFGPFR